MTVFCTVVIITHNRPASLDKILQSMAQCTDVETVELIVVENNRDCTESKDIVERFDAPKQVKYIKTDDRSPAKARNLGTAHANGRFMIFFDDDITLGTNILTSYIAAAKKHGAAFFYGGPLIPSCEEQPLYWLRNYLPPSALGYSAGEVKKEVTNPEFLGANMGFFNETLTMIGGIPEYLGTTEHYPALGEESVLQRRLLDKGLKGLYLPDSVIRHHVPPQNCSYEFALHRSYRLGLTHILTQFVENGQEAPAKTPLWMRRNQLELKFLIGLKKLMKRPLPERAAEEIALAHQRGAIDAVQHLRDLKLVEQFSPKNNG